MLEHEEVAVRVISTFVQPCSDKGQGSRFERLCLCPVQYEGGEPCSVCGHRLVIPDTTSPKASALPSNILPQFLYLGSYDNASRSELLKTVGITHILNVRFYLWLSTMCAPMLVRMRLPHLI